MSILLIPTIRTVAPPPNYPSDLIDLTPWGIVLPTNSVGQASIADGLLRYTSSDVAGSKADELHPVGNLNYRYFFVEKTAGVWEVVCRAPISGSPTTPVPPSGSNDHTRVEFRQYEPGPSNHSVSGKGDFLLSDNLHFWGVCRPMRFPDRDNTGSTAADNNLTLMQLQPTDGTAGALTTFVILALRKNGDLDATMYGADGANVLPSGADLLLSGVQLGDVIWWDVQTSATQVIWSAENRTRGGGIQTLTITVPNTSAAGVNTRTRYYAHKWGCYHGTNVTQSSDDIAGKRVSGVVPHADVTDYAEVRYREVHVEYLP